MAAIIMNKLTAALNIKTLKSTPKELNSKNTIGEYHTMFTKRLSIDESLSNMNSVDCDDVDHCSHSMCSASDFIGGPIEKTEEHSFDLCEQNIDYNRSIATPADSSCGFHNTFSVLEKYLNKKRSLKLSQQQIEYLLLQNKDLAIHSDAYIDIPINEDRYIHTADSFVDSSMNDMTSWDVGNEKFSSDFSLEAWEKCGSMSSETNIQNASDEIEKSPKQIEDFYQEDHSCIGAKNTNEYIYHVAKQQGQLYIRVRRNLRLDQGKSSNFFGVFLMFQFHINVKF